MTLTMPAARAVRMAAAFGFGLLAVVTTAAAQQHTPERPAARGAVVRQTTLLVEDMDRSLDFYVRLGLSKSSDQTFEDGDQDAIFSATDLPLAADPKIARLVVLKGNNDQASQIGLVAYDKPRLSSARGNLGGLGTGDIIITLAVPDIQDTYHRLAQISTRFQRIPYRFTLTNSDGSHQVMMRMLAYDPDGHLAEIVQSDGGQK